MISPCCRVTWMSPANPSIFTSPTPCAAIIVAVLGALTRISRSKMEKARCPGKSVVTTNSSPWRAAVTRTLSEEAIVVISTSGRSHASTVRMPVDFVNLSAPPEGKSIRCVLAAGAFCWGSSAASSRLPAPNPSTANIRIVMRNLFMYAITRLVYAPRFFYRRQMIRGARPPDIKGRQQENAHSQVGDQASHYYDGKGALGIGAYRVG